MGFTTESPMTSSVHTEVHVYMWLYLACSSYIHTIISAFTFMMNNYISVGFQLHNGHLETQQLSANF